MDYDKYYKIDYDGSYSLHFLNKDQLNEIAIRKIFSPFGKVLNVHITETGLTFIKYKTLQEVINCWKGLKDNSTLNLLLEKSKMNKRMDKRDFSQQQAAKMENLLKKPFNDNKPLNSNFLQDKNVRENSTRIRTSNESNRSDLANNYEKSVHKHDPNMTRGTTELNLEVFDKNPVFLSNQTSIEPSNTKYNTPTNIDVTKVDFEKYYRMSKDGAYTVHFINSNNLSLIEINNLFSPYGNVLAIYSNGENSGFKFIKYKTLDEVTKCIKGLQNSDKISILQQKNKKVVSEIQTDQRSLNQWQVVKTEDASQTFGTHTQFNLNSTYNGRSSENPRRSFHNTKIDLSKSKDNTDYFLDTTSSSRQDKFNGTGIKCRNTGTFTGNSYLKQQNPMNNKDHDQIMKEKQQENKLYPMETETNFKMGRNKDVSKIPALISDTETKSNDSDARSDSLLSDGTRKSLSKRVVLMQEIIIANIHMNYGINYILHLLEKHEPISATFVKTIPENNVRYCHVYFKTVQDAVAVEKEFDNFDLYGKNLIVLRTSRLIAKTICR